MTSHPSPPLLIRSEWRGVDESELSSRFPRLTPFLMGSQERPDEGEVFEVNCAELGS